MNDYALIPGDTADRMAAFLRGDDDACDIPAVELDAWVVMLTANRVPIEVAS